ncbi:MAG: transposase, partial [Pseudomonadota bacterium]
MMGQQIEHASLFYEFNLEDRVPEGHLLRRVDAVLDLSFVRRHMASHYSATGRPSIDPELMVRMLLIGYLFGIRSERRLCEEVDLNLAYRWFCRLDLAGKVPDHSTFTKNQHGRFRESDLMRTVFETTVEQCLSAGTVSLAHVAVDGSHMRASAAQDRCVGSVTELPSADQASRAVRDYLADLDQASPDLEGVRRSTAKRVSLTDPAVALSRKHGKARFAYGMNALIDTGSGVVLGVQAARERFADEPEAARRMIDRLRVRHDMVPQVLTADKAYGSGPFWRGSKSAGSRRMFLSSTALIRRLDGSPMPTSSTTKRVIDISALKARRCGVSATRVAKPDAAARPLTEAVPATARDARSRRAAPRARREPSAGLSITMFGRRFRPANPARRSGGR